MILDVGLRKCFLHNTKRGSNKSKNKQAVLGRAKNLRPHQTIIQTEKQPTEWEETSENRPSGTGPIFKICKKLI